MIKITIKGRATKIEVLGVAGPSCREKTRALEERLGGETLSREATAEAHLVPEFEEASLELERP